jgi:hypothetical protein
VLGQRLHGIRKYSLFPAFSVATSIPSNAQPSSKEGNNAQQVNAIVPNNSVGTQQLKPNAVGLAQIKANAITSAKVRDFTLRAWDFKKGDLPAGPRGANGPAGPAGPAGVIGDLTLRENSVSIPGNTAGNSLYTTRAVQVMCLEGEKAITGGTSWSSDVNDEELQTMYSRHLLDDKGKPIGWRARGGTDIAPDRVFSVQVLCAK